MTGLSLFNRTITIVFLCCYLYQFAFISVSWFFRRQQTESSTVLHKYAVMICARNEEYVIGDLIDSIHAQTYPQDMLDIYVMADNCTDSTAETARAHGANVYQRYNKEQIGKGYALHDLMHRIRKDQPEGYDGYFVFDADNVLEKDYVEKMNRSYCEGNEIIASYRASKNDGYNWISAGYGLWFLRESRYLNLPRMLVGSSCFISGTGFFFGRKTAEEMRDWPYHLLTEDIEFTADMITRGRKISFCKDAVFYDEQPVTFSQSWHQRLRWCRGYLQVLMKYGTKLIYGTLRGQFACFDLIVSMMPAYILSILSLLVNLGSALYNAFTIGFTGTAGTFLTFAFNMYLTLFIVGLITAVTERKQIHTTMMKRILYVFTFPLFMFTYIPIAFSALFTRCSWKPVKHMFSAKEMYTRNPC